MPRPALLAIFAHPDDESFGTGGTLAHYAAQGVHVALVCATRGDAGEISDPALATPETLGDVREGELRCAASALGVADLVLLGYGDSGMAGTPRNQDPDAFVNAAPDEVVAQLVGVVRRVRPQVVITFDPSGGYGHPDHVAVHHHAVAAFHAAGDSTRFPDQGPAWQPSRLFYSVFPRSRWRRMREELAMSAEEAEQFERFEREGYGWPDDQIHATLDVSAEVGAKLAALECHRTQIGPDHRFRRIPEAKLRDFFGREYFALAWPTSEERAPLTDLFAGL